MTLSASRGYEVAHDVNGLMSSLLLVAQRLETHTDSAVLQHGQRVVEIADRIVEICRAELAGEAPLEAHGPDCLALMLTEIDAVVAPRRTAEDIPYALRLQMDGDIDFECSAPTLFRVLYNLIANAAKALNGCDAARIDVFATQHDGKLFLQIADNGPGLPGPVRAWFASRATCKPMHRRQAGTGLTNVAASLARAGGEMKLIQTGRDGTRIGLSLPVAPMRNSTASDYGLLGAMATGTMPGYESDPENAPISP